VQKLTIFLANAGEEARERQRYIGMALA